MKVPLWGTVLTVIGVFVLCALGVWQLERLSWKSDIIAKLDAAYDTDKPAWLGLDQDFSYGRTAGQFLSDKALLVGPRTHDGVVGYDLIVPLLVKGGRTLLVNMGWTAEKDAAALPIHHALRDRVYFTGLLRKPEWNSFTPANVPDKNAWYRLDPQDIAQAKGLLDVLPYVLYAEKSSYAFEGQFPNTQRQYPNNNHLQYALFWFVMAGAMIVVYGMRFIRKA